MKFKGRSFLSGEITNDKITFKQFDPSSNQGKKLRHRKYSQEVSIFLKDISHAEISRSFFDIPFLESTITIQVKGGGLEYQLPMIRKKVAKELYRRLTS